MSSPSRRTVIICELVSLVGYVGLAVTVGGHVGMMSDWFIDTLLAVGSIWALVTSRLWAAKAVIVTAAYIGLPHPLWLPWRVEGVFRAETLDQRMSYVWIPLIAVAQLVAFIIALRNVRSVAPAA